MKNLKTYFNRVITEPNEEVTELFGITVSATDVTGAVSGKVIAVAKNIKDIRVGDTIHYNSRVEEIIIEDERYHIIGYNNVYWGIKTNFITRLINKIKTLWEN